MGERCLPVLSLEFSGPEEVEQMKIQAFHELIEGGRGANGSQDGVRLGLVTGRAVFDVGGGRFGVEMLPLQRSRGACVRCELVNITVQMSGNEYQHTPHINGVSGLSQQRDLEESEYPHFTHA